MQQQPPEPSAGPSDTAVPEVPFGSNAVRLTPRQWVAAVVLLLAAGSLLPKGWSRMEPLDATPDYRIPHPLGYDYWIYQRYCRDVCRQDRTLVLGDSVVWGHYVSSDETLSHYLNKLAGEDRFANLGVDGIHPVAMAGLVESYGRPIAGREVILHCNFLWMSSQRHDLQTSKEFNFNHPELVPQFFPRIPCYRESFFGRLGIVVGREVPFCAWTRHLQIAYFDNATLPEWTDDHPYANPVTLRLPSPNDLPSPEPDARPWTEKHLARFNPDWVELETSFQWAYFRRIVEILQRRGNRVFVLIGPFNEPMLTAEGLRGYQAIQSEAMVWLAAHGVQHFAATTLPSESYADASHPLASGYKLLAEEVFKNEAFRQFLSSR